jgi:hypothetical protein
MQRAGSMLRIAGFAVFAAAAVCAVSYWHVDRQAFRLAEKSLPAYLFVPVRLQGRWLATIQ